MVLNIAYVDNKILSDECFYVLLITCFLLNITAPILITLWKPYYEGKKMFQPCGSTYFMKELQKGGMGGGRTTTGRIVLTKEMFEEMNLANITDNYVHPELHPSLHLDHPEYEENLHKASALLHEHHGTEHDDDKWVVAHTATGKVVMTEEMYEEMMLANKRDDALHPKLHPSLHVDHPEYEQNLIKVSRLLHAQQGDVTPAYALEETLSEATK